MIVAGRVRTQAVAICHAVDGCNPAPDPTIVPEMPPSHHMGGARPESW